MVKRLYVGNLGFSVSSAELRELFESFGEVVAAQVVDDRETGKSRGFGFVEMAQEADADAAIQALDGRDHLERRLNISEAKPRESGGGPRPGGSRGGGFRSGGQGGGRPY